MTCHSRPWGTGEQLASLSGHADAGAETKNP